MTESDEKFMERIERECWPHDDAIVLLRSGDLRRCVNLARRGAEREGYVMVPAETSRIVSEIDRLREELSEARAMLAARPNDPAVPAPQAHGDDAPPASQERT